MALVAAFEWIFLREDSRSLGVLSGLWLLSCIFLMLYCSLGWLVINSIGIIAMDKKSWWRVSPVPAFFIISLGITFPFTSLLVFGLLTSPKAAPFIVPTASDCALPLPIFAVLVIQGLKGRAPARDIWRGVWHKINTAEIEEQANLSEIRSEIQRRRGMTELSLDMDSSALADDQAKSASPQ
jgi:hypothetical protein